MFSSTKTIACDCAGHGPSAIVLAIDLLPVLADRDGFAVDPPLVFRPACPRLFYSIASQTLGCALDTPERQPVPCSAW